VAGGKVWLVGAGPGDPGLITLKGAKALEAAEAVVYDRLANPALLEMAPPESQRIYAGKLPGADGSSQTEINELLVKLAKEGKRVVRLKGGDPFVFGRGGEEAQALKDAGIAFEVIPGVSSAVAVPTYAGIPVSHRGVASSFTVFTGHEDPSKTQSTLRWKELASGADTLVSLMGVQGLQSITDKLIEAGRSPETPSAVISSGTLSSQRVVVGTLKDVANKAGLARLEAPAVAVFGDVVSLREQLQWFETRPLFGKRILITRTREQASGLRTMLEDEGAKVIELPTLEIVDGASPQLLGRVIDAMADGEYGWVLFTSVNGVRRFLGAVQDTGRDARAFHDSKIAAVGPATAEALRDFGIRADAMPEEYEGRQLGLLLAGHDLARRRILVPRADAARPELIQILRARGAEVEEVPLYSSEVPRNPDPAILGSIRAGEIDVITFASSSAVRNLAKMMGDEFGQLKQAVTACIGPSTAEAARRCGLTPAVVATQHTIPGLVESLRDFFQREGSLAAP
jgi:uroporphyrinogen III methyltransferase / synthase